MEEVKRLGIVLVLMGGFILVYPWLLKLLFMYADWIFGR